MSGSAPLAIGGGSVSDVFSENERAAGMALYTLGPLLGKSPRLLRNRTPTNSCIGGPAIGPVAGGFIAQNLGIKWVFIVIASMFSPCLLFTHNLNSYILSAKVLCAVAAVVGIPFLRETYGPVVLRRKALRALRSGDAETAVAAEKILASDPL